MKKLLLITILCVLSGCQYDASTPTINKEDVIWAVQPSYSSASNFSSGYAIVGTESESFQINQSGSQASDTYQSISIGFNGHPRYDFNMFGLPCLDNFTVLMSSGTTMKRSFDNFKINWYDGNPFHVVQEDNQKYGLVNNIGQWVVEPKFDSIEVNKGIPLCYLNNTTYFVNKAGLPIKVSNLNDFFISSSNNAYFIAGHSVPPHFNSTEFFIIDGMTGQKVLEQCFYESPHISNCEYFTFADKGLYGVMDFHGNITVEPQYSDAGWFSEGVVSVQNYEGKIAYIDYKGSIVVPFREGIYGDSFYNGMAAFAVNKHGTEKIGIIDMAGKWVVKPEYDSYFYHEDKNVWELVIWTDTDDIVQLFFPEQQLITAEYDYALDLVSTDTFIAQNNDLSYVVNTSTGKEKRTEFGTIYEHSEGLIRASDKGSNLIGFADCSGAWVYIPQFEDAKPFYEGLAAVKVNGKWGYVSNPLFYTSWHESEADRAYTVLGYTNEINKDEIISVKEFVILLAKHVTTADMDLVEWASNGDRLSRAVAADIISEVMEAHGRYYDYYLPEVEDVDLFGVSHEIAYVLQAGFMVPKDSLFTPMSFVSHSDAIIIAYRIALDLLD